MKHVAGLALALVVALSGCSDAESAENSTADPSTSVRPVPSAAVTASSGSSTPERAPTPTEPAPTPTVAPVTATPITANPITATSPNTTVGAGTAGEWCAVAIDLHDLTTAFRELDADNRGAVQMSLVAILERLDTIAPLAPPGLADDLAVSAEAFALLDDALAEVGYELGAADLAALDARTEAITAANDRIRAYNARECGIDVGVTGADAP